MSQAVLQSVPHVAAAADTLPETDPALVRRVFEAQRATALRWRTSTAAERIMRLQRLRDAVLSHQDALHAAFAQDMRKNVMEVDGNEILPVLAEVRDAVSEIKGWMKRRRVGPTRLTLGNSAWIEYQPRGRSLIVAPWNFPLNLSLVPLISALAAGCPAIVKPSEMAPRVSRVIARIIESAFPAEEVAVMQGGLPTSQALLDLPFDHIFFTGSPAIGRSVMAAAAKHLASVTLELGGKSPTIVDETADIPRAAANLMWGKLTNSGQICLAPDYVYVHESVKQRFIDACLQVIRERYGADAQKSPDLTRIVNRRHTQRIAALLDDARERGARVLCGGQVDTADCYVAPTLLADVPLDAKVMQEEIFGPLLPIHGYTSLDAVIEEINARPKPLALYIWSDDRRRAQYVIDRTSSGGVCINHCILHVQHGHLPFGGVNESGLGSCHGHFGFKAFSHERAVLRSWKALMPVKYFYAPYTPQKLKMVQLFMKLMR
jgi:aldehyde dehydrogenase (NAD+)